MEEDKSLKKFWIAAVWPAMALLVMWVVWYLDRSMGLDLYEFGVYPKDAYGLKGIIFSPWIHDARDSAHIINNSVPLIVLMWALFYFYRKIAWQVFLLIWLVGGLCVWMAARPSYHIGMSGVIYGMATFIFVSGAIRKNTNLLAIAMLVAFEYGSMVWGVLPYREGMSWEGHLWGAVVGLTMAIYYRKKGPQRKKYPWEISEEAEERRLREAEAKFGVGYWKVQSRSDISGETPPGSRLEKEDESENAKPLRRTERVRYVFKPRKE